MGVGKRGSGFILFYFILFYFILFYFILFYFCFIFVLFILLFFCFPSFSFESLSFLFNLPSSPLQNNFSYPKGAGFTIGKDIGGLSSNLSFSLSPLLSYSLLSHHIPSDFGLTIHFSSPPSSLSSPSNSLIVEYIPHHPLVFFSFFFSLSFIYLS